MNNHKHFHCVFKLKKFKYKEIGLLKQLSCLVCMTKFFLKIFLDYNYE